MQRKGFSLIELLVVIAIIAILAAVLFPIFISAKMKAQQASCASNTQQIGKALLLYLQDFNETLPENARARYDLGLAYPKRWFSNQMGKYVKSEKVWNCPTAKPEPGCFHSAAGRDYGMAAQYILRRTSSFNSTIKSPVFTDCHYNAFYSDQEWAENPSFYDSHYMPNRVHMDGANYVFLDGHAKWSKAKLAYVVYNGYVEYRLADQLDPSQK